MESNANSIGADTNDTNLNVQRKDSVDEMSWILKSILDSKKPKIEDSKKQGLPTIKYLFVCGSTISGIGKGSTMSALGILLKTCGLRVNCIKIDPYLNIDAGTMSPFEHGEVFVLEDGGEVDLDLGNYERSMRLTLTKDHNITSGKVFHSVIMQERKGGYLGKTVQMIPHVTDKIKEMIMKAAHNIVEKEKNKVSDICLVEVGGTVGDIESGLFLEAIRQFTHDVGEENCAILLLSYVPEIGSDPGEPKTKPTQFGVREMKSLGLFPNFLVCRSKYELDPYYIRKLAFSANLSEENVITCYNVDTIWDVPVLLASQNLHFKIMSHLGLPFREYKIHKWIRLSEHIRKMNSATEVKIAVCGKYMYTSDTYYSVMKSLQDASFSASRKLSIEWLDCTVFDPPVRPEEEEQRKKNLEEFWRKLESCNGILVPGGFGKRGIEGMIQVVRYARENMIPFLGICLGMQVAVIEFCRNVLGIKNANSKEFSDDCVDCITTMNDTDYNQLGGTLRLGLKKSLIKDKNSLAYKIYGADEVLERHRHRYEVNPTMVKDIEAKGMIFSGKDHESERMTILEIPSHPFFFASQYHPEYKTNPFHPTPTFYSFFLTASKQYDKFKEYVIHRKPGISKLDSDSDEMIISENQKYQTMITNILTDYEKIKEELSGGKGKKVNVNGLNDNLVTPHSPSKISKEEVFEQSNYCVLNVKDDSLEGKSLDDDLEKDFSEKC